MNRLVIIGVVLVLAGLGGGVRDAGAGGIISYELGTSDVGRATAGWAARADDAATLFTNPAGMARLSGRELLIGGQLTYGNFAFTPDGNTTVEGNDGGNAVGAIPVGGMFYTQELGSGWSAGIGAFSYFGLGAEYDDGWVGRYTIKESSLLGFTVMPAISYRVNAHLSFGAGFNWMFGAMEQKTAVKNYVEQTDGEFELSDDTQGFGANAGVLAEFDGTRLGVTYLSQVKLDFEDTPEFTGLGPFTEEALRRAGILGARLDLGMTVPQTLMASAYHELSEDWAVMGNVGWQNWNEFGKVRVAVADTLLSTTTDLQYSDTWHVAVGAEWGGVAPGWLLTGGVAYDSSPMEDEDRTVSLPMAETWRFGVGAEWAKSERVELGFAYELGWLGSMPVDEYRELGNTIVRRVSGEFENALLHMFALNLTWKI